MLVLTKYRQDKRAQKTQQKKSLHEENLNHSLYISNNNNKKLLQVKVSLYISS